MTQEAATQEKADRKPADRHQTSEPADAAVDPIEPVDAEKDEKPDDGEFVVMDRHQTINPVD